MKTRLHWMVSLALAGCLGEAVATEERLDDAVDAATRGIADFDCRVTLRRFENLGGGQWRILVDSDKFQIWNGAQTRVMIRRLGAGAAWTVLSPETTTETDSPRLFQNDFLVSAAQLGLAGTEPGDVRVELIPYLEVHNANVYDHNTVPEGNHVVSLATPVKEYPRMCSVAPAPGLDTADRSCKVVLRSIAPLLDHQGHQVVENRFFVWEGFLDVASSAVSARGLPALLWNGKLGDNAVVRAAPVGGGLHGYHRFKFHLVSDITAESPGAGQIDIPVIPYLEFPSGARVFDHNNTEGNYVLDLQTNNWAITNPGPACK